MGNLNCVSKCELTIKLASILKKASPPPSTNENPSQPRGETEQPIEKKKRSILLIVREKIVRSVEVACGLWGLQVARHPFLAIMGILLLVTFWASGLARINLIFRPYDLWVPRNSEFARVTDWSMENFPRLYREQVAIWEAENVLSASVIRKMWEFHLEAMNITVPLENRTIKWKDVCVQIPTDSYGSSDSFICYESSLLEIWGYEDVFSNITDSDVIEGLQTVDTSKVYGTPTNFSIYLGGIAKDETNKIISAKTAVHTWFTRVNEEEIQHGQYELDIGTGEKVDTAGMEWEKALVRLAEKYNNGDLRINLKAGHTLGYVLHSSITRDAIWIGVGWTVLLIYVLLTLGKPLQEDQQMIPACVGLVAIGLSVLASYGACSMMGIPYGTLTNVLPILLVALGVDDMYVIITSWECFKHIDAVDCRTRLSMQKAGMAITVTSLTDVMAFLVGTTTELPGLQWFCIYSSVGVSMVYLLQSTLFVASIVLNQRWKNRRKKNKKENDSNFTVGNHECQSWFCVRKCMEIWGTCLNYRTTKAIVFVLTSIMFAYSIFNITLLSREFDTIWLVPESSSLYKWYHTVETTFPHKNEKGIVFFKGVNLPDDLEELKNLSKNLSSLPEVLDVEAWFNEVDIEDLFHKYPSLKEMSPMKQCQLLLQFLGVAKQRHFRVDFTNEPTFSEVQKEGSQPHPCSTFQIEFQYIPPKTFKCKQESMERIRQLVNNAPISGHKAVWAHVFGQWETDRVILEDLFKSLCIVLSAVGVISLILLASARAAFFVLLCVVGTLVNVASSVYLWGLTINTVTGIAFILAIGICVDYAAHIAHEFLRVTGTKPQRVSASLRQIGSAVFHGGSSTCLTFVLLSPSDNYIYISYFKILTSVSFFGLYHALVFLPVLLSLFGPDPHPREDTGELRNNVPSAPAKSNTPCTIQEEVASIYTIELPPPLNPPPYVLSHTVWPPLYRKSSSLPSLAIFLDDVSVGSCSVLRRESYSAALSPTSSSNKLLEHSACCTKL